MLYLHPAMLSRPRCHIGKDVGNHCEWLLRHHLTVSEWRSLYCITTFKRVVLILVANIFHNLLALATDSGLLSNDLKYFLRPG